MAGAKSCNKRFVTVGELAVLCQFPDFRMLFFVDGLQLFRVVAITEIGSAAQWSSLPFHAKALFPEGTQNAVGAEGFGVLLSQVVQLHARGVESVVHLLEVTAVTTQPAFYAALLNLFVNPPVDLLEGFPFSIAGGCPGLVFVVQWVDFTAQELVAALFVSVAAVRLDCGIR